MKYETMKDDCQMLKIKLTKKGADISYVEDVLTPGGREVTNIHSVESSHKPHDDFISRLNALRRHVINICEIEGGCKLNQLTVTGVTFAGMDSDDGANVIIVAKKTLRRGIVLNLVTPGTTLNDPEDYSGAVDLDNRCSMVVKEAWAYLDGKHLAEPQQEIEFANAESDLKITANGIDISEKFKDNVSDFKSKAANDDTLDDDDDDDTLPFDKKKGEDE